MRRLLLSLIILASASAYGQTYIKMNAPAAILGVFNPSIETKISTRLTYSFDLTATFWNRISIFNKEKLPFRILMFQNEVRYFPTDANRGFFFSPNLGYAMFRMQKWGHEDQYQVGWSIQAGFTLGYEWHYKEKWLGEIFIGGGRQWAKYEGFNFTDGSRYVGYNGSAEYMPYKGGINIGYRLGK